MPPGYHRMGRVLLVRLPRELLAYGDTIGSAWKRELGVETVLAQNGPVEGELRRPRVQVLAGTETTTEVVEHGVRYRFDAAEVMFATGNRTERQRIAKEVAPGEVVVDLFAGIGYFILPIATQARPAVVWAVEKNPVSYRYLRENLVRNAVAVPVETLLGDNRAVALPRKAADRLILGYLPDSRPWIGRALELARPDGAWLHVHLVHDVRLGPSTAARTVEEAVRSHGGEPVGPGVAREVKPYGPGRSHVVVDVRARPQPS